MNAICFQSIFMLGTFLATCFVSMFMWGIFCVQSIGYTSLCPDTVWWVGARGGVINCCYNTHAWD